MTANVGGIDRILRIVVGIALLSLFFVLEGNARYLGLIGLVMIATGLFRFCPAYTLLGMNTCGMKKGYGRWSTARLPQAHHCCAEAARRAAR